MKPNKQNIRAWVEALRSGKYKQTTDVLARIKDGEVIGHCCLGVACELAFVRQRREPRKVVYDGADICLPSSVQEWLGLEMAEPVLKNGGSLTKLNDTGASFAHIADLIEAEYLTA